MSSLKDFSSSASSKATYRTVLDPIPNNAIYQKCSGCVDSCSIFICFRFSLLLSNLDVLLLLQLEDVAVELLLQFLVGVVDAELSTIPIPFLKIAKGYPVPRYFFIYSISGLYPDDVSNPSF